MNQQSQPTSLYPVERGDELDLIGLWKVLVEYKRLIIVFTTLTTLGAIYYASTIPTIYKAEVLMLPVSGGSASIASRLSSRLGGLASMAGVSLGDSSAGIEGEQALARLKTRSFLINHVKEKNLKPILFANQWSQSGGVWINEEPSDREASELLLDMITTYMNPKDKARLVIFSLEWENPTSPNKIADMANDLVSSMNYHAKQHAIVEAKNSISFLEKELEQTSILNSQTMLYSIIEQQVQKIMLANIRDEFVFKVIDAAVNPTKPEPSKMILITLLGGFLGGFISIFLAIFHNYIKREVRYK
jgi:uncharacterized protein involved in exopolysaccharide biosynthesis